MKKQQHISYKKRWLTAKDIRAGSFYLALDTGKRWLGPSRYEVLYEEGDLLEVIEVVSMAKMSFLSDKEPEEDSLISVYNRQKDCIFQVIRLKADTVRKLSRKEAEKLLVAYNL